MAKQYLRHIIQCATALEAALQDNDDLPGWVNAKIATADDRLNMVTQYMMYEIRRHAKDGEQKYSAESWKFQPSSGGATTPNGVAAPKGTKK
jgi:hypothetical protein